MKDLGQIFSAVRSTVLFEQDLDLHTRSILNFKTLGIILKNSLVNGANMLYHRNPWLQKISQQPKGFRSHQPRGRTLFPVRYLLKIQSINPSSKLFFRINPKKHKI